MCYAHCSPNHVIHFPVSAAKETSQCLALILIIFQNSILLDYVQIQNFFGYTFENIHTFLNLRIKIYKNEEFEYSSEKLMIFTKFIEMRSQVTGLLLDKPSGLNG